MSDEIQPSHPESQPDEPTVLDLFKSIFKDWKSFSNFLGTLFNEARREQFNRDLSEEREIIVEPEPEPFTFNRPVSSQFPWRALLGLGFALFGQRMLEPPGRNAMLGIAFYALAISLVLWGVFSKEIYLSPIRPRLKRIDPLRINLAPLLFSMIMFVFAFAKLTNNQFTTTNITLWIMAIFSLIWSFWIYPASIYEDLESTPDRKKAWARTLRSWLLLVLATINALFLALEGPLFKNNERFWALSLSILVITAWVIETRAIFRLRNWFMERRNKISISPWSFFVFLSIVLVIFFRVYHIGEVPLEPFSDHAEKILDVYDVTQGQTRIFFPRNTGREGFQMYWTVLMDWIFGTGLSFLSLKIGTVLIGLLTLPYMYLLGKEIGGKRVGLFALLLTGIGYWPNVISRVGLRFPLYPAFAAPVLYYLIQGLRKNSRNDFILSGLFLGIGLHGYSPIRIVPLVVIIAIGLYLVHAQSRGNRREAILWLVILGLTSLFVFTPLLRYWIDNPSDFSYRALSRLGGVERDLAKPAIQVFFSNLWDGLRMFNWDDGEIWVHSVTHRPALGVVSGALFLIGVVLMLVRYLRRRHWLDLFLLLSIPLLALPSILSLAYPGENPALNRAGGAYIPAFLLAALALDSLVSALVDTMERDSGRRKIGIALAWGLTLVLFFWSGAQNYDLVFNQYAKQFENGAWNSSEMGAVIKAFGEKYGTTDTVWIVPFPYWVDTRLPGVWAGVPNRDFAVWQENLADTLPLAGPKLFIVKANINNPDTNDQATLDILQQLYPQGNLEIHHSKVVGHEFWVYSVPAQ